MSTVDEVKARLDIVDVVGGYTRLQKAGRYFKAPCPFHQEKTPSFYVYPERQSWHCFGACATGGDIIAFVSKKESLDFQSTLRLLADRAGVELRSEGPRREEIKSLQDANDAAALYFHSLLASNRAAHAYIEGRGLDQKAISDFQIGFAPPGWNNLRDHLRAKGYAEQQLIEAGLLIEGERGTYDRFRERIMFPIRDERGRVVGFGGRIFQESNGSDIGPKYMNTPQTPIFDKGGVLYALDRSREEMRKEGTAVIVEGYMDVIAAHQNGYRNVVASMGTALTDRQAALLQRFASRVVLAMDSDEAGKAANLRAIQVVAASAQRPALERPNGTQQQARSLDIRVLALPQGKDPDELIRNDANAWLGAVQNAQPVVDHLIAVVSAGMDLTDPRERSRLVADVLPAVGEVADPVMQAHYLQRLSRLARVSEDTLRRQMPRRARQQATRRRDEDENPAGGNKEGAKDVLVVKAMRDKREEYALALLYLIPELEELGRRLPDDLFNLSENRELLRRWREDVTTSEEESELYEHLQQVLRTQVRISETQQAQEAFLDCVGRLEQAKMKAVMEASALALAEGEAGVRPGQVASLARAKLDAGEEEETSGDGAEEALASQFLDSMNANLRYHRRTMERHSPHEAGRRNSQ